MELIRGKSLEALVKEKGTLDPLEASGYIIQAAQGLRHAAQKGLIHRDIKPSNLMLTEDGTLKITDFGLAKAARSETQLTATGEVLGSPGYISPEQAQGIAIDLRSDIYSLGATFYQLVTGKLPFDASTAVAMVIKHINEPLRSPRAVNPSVPFLIAATIQRMMAKRPGERFQDYDALQRELERAVGAARAGGSLNAAVAGAAGSPSVPRRPPPGGGAGPARTRPVAAPMPAAEPSTGGRSISWLPLLLLLVLGVMVTAGVWQRITTAPEARSESARDPAVGGDASPPPERTAAASTAGAGSQKTPDSESDNRQVSRRELREGGAGPLAGWLRQQRAQKAGAHLTFVTNDHEVLPNGRLKIVGEVKNTGKTIATQARVRVSILLEDGRTAAQGETPLEPGIIAPGATAIFQLPIDYSGPFGTISAELTWKD
jgi:serine/threonine-protein kinase